MPSEDTAKEVGTAALLGAVVSGGHWGALASVRGQAMGDEGRHDQREIGIVVCLRQFLR